MPRCCRFLWPLFLVLSASYPSSLTAFQKYTAMDLDAWFFTALQMMDVLLLACCFSMIREGQPAYSSAPWLSMLYTAGLVPMPQSFLSMADPMHIHDNLHRNKMLTLVSVPCSCSCWLLLSSVPVFYHGFYYALHRHNHESPEHPQPLPHPSP